MKIEYIYTRSIYTERTEPIKGEVFKGMFSSLKLQGQMMPLTVFQTGEFDYKIIDGYLRWRVAREIGMETLSCAIVDITEEQYHEIRRFHSPSTAWYAEGN